jgi:anti-sigma factor RsiW
MDYEAQLKLQAYLDGELPDREAKEVADRLAQDREAGALLGELRATHQALIGFETGVALPESREFFWSKIQREIEQTQPEAPEPAAGGLGALLRRLLLPATAVAALALGVFVVLRPPAGISPETALADPGAFTYHDYSAGTTLVWLSYPAEEELAQDDEMGSE